jgi:hypothetical protein
MPVLKSVNLAFQEGTSDKVYNVSLTEESGVFTVAAWWGKRGAKLTMTEKYSGTDYWHAVAFYDAAVGEKTKKGYQSV